MLNQTSVFQGGLEIILQWEEGRWEKDLEKAPLRSLVESLGSNVLHGCIAILIRLHAKVNGVFVPNLWKNA